MTQMKNIDMTVSAIYNNKNVDVDITVVSDDGYVTLENDSEKIRIPKDMFIQAIKSKIFKFVFPIKERIENE